MANFHTIKILAKDRWFHISLYRKLKELYNAFWEGTGRD